MRTSRLSLVGTIVLALVASLSVTVVAWQAEEDRGATTATYVTGVMVSEGGESDYPEWEMDWSDPRLPSRVLYLQSSDGGPATHPDGSVMAVHVVSAVRLEGPDGGWSGTSRVLAWMLEPESGGEFQDIWTELLVLEGEGDYEGLSAIFRCTDRGYGPGPYEGFIFEGPPPSVPDPIEPVGE